MGATKQAEADYDAPLPMGTFKRFVYAFHVIFIGGLFFSLVLRWHRLGFAGSFEDVAIVALVLVQVALYWLFMIRIWKPPTLAGWWLGYFSSGYVIWLLEWKLEGSLQWTAWAYLGQMFGVMRPVYSVPGSVLVFATYFGASTGLKGLLGRSFWEWAGALSVMTSMTLLGLFLYRLTSTSSERAALIQKLEAAQKELEQARERDAELAALKERERLARELHDSLGHGLVTLTVQLEAAQRLYLVDPQRGSALLDDMKALTRSSMEQLRRALAGLRAPGLGDRPLLGALRELCADAAKGGLEVRCQVPESADGLAPALSEALWRVAQEGLTNVQRHAKARRAELQLETTSGEVVLRVRDDGVGVAADAEGRPGHYGLRGSRERIEGLGGTFSVIAVQPNGTELLARLPRVER